MIFRLLVISVFLVNVVFGQEKNLEFTGKITSLNAETLLGANVLLMAKNKEVSPSFAVANENGIFIANVALGIEYNLTITFIGFETIKKTIRFSENTTLNFTMTEAANELEEVVLNYKPPIIIKKDTTTYDVEAFTNGKERKLGELLKKLPGVVVNRKGEVFVKNKKVTKVLVEDRTFFNGRTKLAVENIPADVISKIEMIEDYNETAFLKGLEDSDELVMNIILKEDKKNFMFGDIEIGAGIEDRYRVHPSVFKYNPKYLINFIGDANNTYNRSFTLSDYFAFEGTNNPENIGNVLNSTLGRFLQNENYTKNEHLFAGFNGQWNPDNINEVRLFAIGLRDDSFAETTNNFVYQANQATEKRIARGNKENQIFLGKLNYKYTPDKNTVFKWSTSIENTRLNANNENISEVASVAQSYEKNDNAPRTVISSNIDFNKYFSRKNTSTLSISYRYESGSLREQWLSDDNLFSPVLPVTSNAVYDIRGFEQKEVDDYGFEFKHFFRPSNTDLISIEISGAIKQLAIEVNNFQELQADVNNFEGFANIFSSNLNSISSTFLYTRYFGKVRASAGIVHQNISWNDTNNEIRTVTTNNNLLPSARLEYDLSDKKTLKLIFNSSSDNPDGNTRINQSKLISFNTIYTGNPFLQQEFNDRLSLSYSSFKTYGLSSYYKLNYKKQKDQIVSSNTFNGINGVRTPVQLEQDNLGYDASLRLKYNRRYWNMAFTNNLYYSEQFSISNSQEVKNLGNRLYNSLDFTTNFEEFPNIDFEVGNSYIQSNNTFFKNKTNITNFDLALQYDYKNWKYDFSYVQTLFNNKTQNRTSDFNEINGSIFYHKEDSLWEFGIDFFNLGNTSFQESNSFNPDIFSEERILVFPRTIMFNIYYKL